MNGYRIAAIFGGGIVGAAIGYIIGEAVAEQVAINQFYENEEGDTSEMYETIVERLYSPNEEELEEVKTKKQKQELTILDANKKILIVDNENEKRKREMIAAQNQILYPKASVEEEDDEVDYSEYDEEDIEEDLSPNGPYVVNEYSWSSNPLNYTRHTLLYYNDDDVLLNPLGDVIAHPEELLGSDGLTSFGEGCEDPDTVFIQVDETNDIYEVVRLHESYSEAVLGLDPEDEMEKLRKEAKKRRSSAEKLE